MFLKFTVGKEGGEEEKLKPQAAPSELQDRENVSLWSKNKKIEMLSFISLPWAWIAVGAG